MKTMGHKIQTRIISALLVFVMVFASIVSAGIVLDVDFGDLFSALGFGSGKDSGLNLGAEINTENPKNQFYTAEGNYGYEITPTIGLKVDGVREDAYTKAGITIPANYNLSSKSASTFDVSFAADGKYIYVLYEFSKAEPIYYNVNYTGGYHHFDLAEFNFNLDAAIKSGSTIQILGALEGGAGAAKLNTKVPEGIVDYYVKHTGKGGYGYNIEFTIDLSKVTGTYEGNKAITFSALSTIATAYSGGSTAPTRTYAFAKNAWGDAHAGGTEANIPKANPSTLVIKSKEFTTFAGNIGHTIEKTTGLALDGVRDEAYDVAGVTLPSAYNTQAGTFNFSMAADSENAYFLYEVTKTSNNTIVYDANHSSKWWFDGADFVFNIDGTENSSYTEVHMNAINEGSAKAGQAISYDNALSKNISDFYVKHIEKGDTYVKYNIEFTIPLSKMGKDANGNHVFSYLAIANNTALKADGTPNGATYPCIANSKGTGGNDPKTAYRNLLVIKNDEAEDNLANVERFTTANKNYGYIMGQSDTALSVDGVKDDAYTKVGFSLPARYNRTTSGSTYDISFAADDTHLYVIYEFDKKEAIVPISDKSKYYWYDCADFLVSLSASESTGSEFRIHGEKEGGKNVATQYGIGSGNGVDNYHVKYTGGNNYNVEFSIPLSSITGLVNGKKALTFYATATIAYSSTSRVYPVAYNAGGADKTKPSMILIDDGKTIETPEAEVDYLTPYSGYGYLLKETDSILTLDGYKDDAYITGLKFSNAYNRVQFDYTATPNENNTYDLYIAADSDKVSFLYEFTDDNIVIDSPTFYYNDGVQFSFNPNGEASGSSGASSIYYKNGPRFDAIKIGSTGIVAPCVLVKTEKGYNVEFTVDRDLIYNSDTFSFLGRSTIADSAEKRTYGFTANPTGGANDSAITKYMSQVHIVAKDYDDSYYDEVVLDAGTDNASGRWKYYIEQTDKAIVNDGVMDEAYNEGLKFNQAYNRVQNGKTKAVLANNNFTVYVAANATNLSFFYEVIDDEIVTTAPSSSTHWNDSLHFRMNNTGVKNGSPYNQIIQAGTEVQGKTFTQQGMNFTYSVVHTDKGYNVEITVPRTGLEGQSTFSFVGCASIAWTLAGGTVKNTYGFTANAGGDATDASLQNYANLFEIVDEIPALDVKASELYTNISDPVAGTVSAVNPANVPDSTTTDYDVYNAYKSNIVLDGYMDETYANAAHFYGDICDNPARNGVTSFDAYVAYGSDGYIYFYVDIDDDYVNCPEKLWNKTYYHTDLFQIYFQHGSDTSTQITYNISAPEFGIDNRVPSGGKEPIAVSKRLTANGWAFEAVIKYNNASLLAGGETVGVKFFYNDLFEYDNELGGNHVSYKKNTVTQSDKKYADKYDTPQGSQEDWACINRVVFQDSANPEANAASVIAAMKADPSKVAIVYPKNAPESLLNLIKYPSLAVQQTSKVASGLNPDYYASLAPLSKTTLDGAKVFEEGDAEIANYTYKVLIGHVTSYAETEAMINVIGYDKYGVGVFGNTVSIIGSTEQMLQKAVDTFKKELTGDLAAKTLYYGTSPAVAGAGLDWLNGERTVTDNGYGSYQIIKSSVELGDFTKYCNALLANGYKLLNYNAMGGTYVSKTFYNSTTIITVSYGLHYENALYVNQSGNGGNNLTNANLDATENSLRISVTSRAYAELPVTTPVEYEKVTDTVYVHATQDWDLAEIVRLENGEFVIFDAAHKKATDSDDPAAILRELYALTNGEKPVVAAWFLTHFHQDHIGGLVDIGLNHADKITVKNVIAHLGSEFTQATCYNYRGTAPSTSDKNNILGFLPAIENLGAKLNVTATGQVYNFANASVEILYTYADSMPHSIAADNTNRTSSIYRLILNVGTTNQSFIITGDATTEEFNLAHKRYGSYLKSDFLQLAHHGQGEANDRCTNFYKAIDPSFIISARGNDDATTYNSSDQAIIDVVKAKYDETVDIDEYIIEARRMTNRAQVEAGKEAAKYSYIHRRLAIPYSVGKVYTDFPGVGDSFTAEFNSTVKGETHSDYGIEANTDNRVTMPIGMNTTGSYVYVANTVYTDFFTDGVMDNAYTYGVHLKSDKDDKPDVDGMASFDVYLVAGQDGKIHVFYEVVDNYYFVDKLPTWDKAYRMDGIDFYYGFEEDGKVQKNIRIKAINGANTVAAQAEYYVDANLPNLSAKDDFAVKVTALDGGAPVIGQPVRYTVEFSIDNNGELFKNGDTFTFAAVANSINDWTSKDEHSNYNLIADNAYTSMMGTYYTPANANGLNNVLVFSTAPAKDQVRPASGSDSDACKPTADVVIDKEIISTIDKSTSIANLQAVYGLGTAYAPIEIDGEMENIYKYGHKVSGKYFESAAISNGDYGFDAYLVYAEDGKLHIFIEVIDKNMTEVNGQKIGYGFESGNEAKYWRRDSIDMYFNYLTDGTTSTAKQIWIGAVAGGDQSEYASEDARKLLPEVGTYFVKMTDLGYNVEFIIDRELRVGDYLEFGIYLNCANSEVVGENNTKYSMTHGSFYSDNYAKKYVSPNEFAYDGLKIVTTDSVTAGSTHHNYKAVVTEPTCTAGGYTTHTCEHCGDSYVDNYTDKTGHNYKAVVTVPTCTAGGYTTHTCEHCGDSYVNNYTGKTEHNYEMTCTATCTEGGVEHYECVHCGDSYEYDVPSLGGHNYNGDNVCDTCGKVVKINSASLSLGENISVNFKVKASQLDDGQIITRAEFEFNGVVYVVEDYQYTSNNEYSFQFSNLGPHQMGDTIKATVYFTYKGNEIATATQAYSILTYCNNQLGKAANSASMKKVLVDMLNYGAIAQIYNNYKTDALVNANLTAEQLAIGTPVSEIPTLQSHQNLNGNGGSAVWKSAGIALGDVVKVNVSVVLPGAPENYKIVMKAAGKTWESAEFTPHTNANRYNVEFAVLNPAQMRDVISFFVYDMDGNIVSSELNYSIETYVLNTANKETTTQKLKDLIYALIKYGDSVAAYVNK